MCPEEDRWRSRLPHNFFSYIDYDGDSECLANIETTDISHMDFPLNEYDDEDKPQWLKRRQS